LANSLNEIYNIKQSIALKLALTLLLISILILPISILTWINNGFHLNYLLHIITVGGAAILLIKNNKYSYDAEFNVSIGVLTLVAAIGAYNFGLNSGVVALLIVGGALTFICLSIKMAVIYGVLSLVGLVILVMLQSHTSAVPMASQNDFVSLPALYTFLCVAVSCGVLCLLIFEHRKKLQNALAAIDKQNEEVKYLANHDYLTGLSSPRLAQEQLELTLNMARRHEFKAAILSIDIDEFRVINDALGHDAGDHTLKEVAKRLKDIIRDTDIACRQGGDEFLVILHYPISKEACDITCKRLLSAFDARFAYEDHELKINLSIGVAIYPDNGTTQLDLRSKANKAMHESKVFQKHHYTFAD
jgi:diguanylate cyclase (GGDEF)-like protein